jgi:hypothetical protein
MVERVPIAAWNLAELLMLIAFYVAKYDVGISAMILR